MRVAGTADVDQLPSTDRARSAGDAEEARPMSVRPAPTRPASRRPRRRGPRSSHLRTPQSRPRPLDPQHARRQERAGAHEEVARCPGRPSSRTSSSWFASAARRVEMCRPSRNTVIRSAMRNTSSRRWLMNNTATPRSRSRWTWSNKRSTSWADSDAVGSSMISTRASGRSPWRSPRPVGRRPPGWPSARVDIDVEATAGSASASAYMCRHRTSCPRLRWPMKMFSATLRSGKIIGSW